MTEVNGSIDTDKFYTGIKKNKPALWPPIWRDVCWLLSEKKDAQNVYNVSSMLWKTNNQKYLYICISVYREMSEFCYSEWYELDH